MLVHLALGLFTLGVLFQNNLGGWWGCAQSQRSMIWNVLFDEEYWLCRPRSGAWEAMKGLPDSVQVKRVTTLQEKDSVMSLLSSSEVDHAQSAFLFNKVQSLDDNKKPNQSCRHAYTRYLLIISYGVINWLLLGVTTVSCELMARNLVVVVGLWQDRPRLLLYAELVVEDKCRKSSKEWLGDARLWNISKVDQSECWAVFTSLISSYLVSCNLTWTGLVRVHCPVQFGSDKTRWVTAMWTWLYDFIARVNNIQGVPMNCCILGTISALLIKFAGCAAWILTYKVWKFGLNPYYHGWNTTFFIGDCFLLAHSVDYKQENS